MNHRNSTERTNPGLDLSLSIPALLTTLACLGCYILLSVARGQSQMYTSPNCPVEVSGVVHDITCAGFENGSIDATVTGGLGPFTYKWSTGATTEDIVNLAPGVYSLTAYDVQQCSDQAIFIVGEPDPLEADVVCNYPTCGGQPDCCLFIDGGTKPYAVFAYYSPNVQTPPNLPHPVITGNGPPSVPGMILRTDIIFIPNADSVLCASHVPNGTYCVLVVDHNFCWVWKVVHIDATSPLSTTAEIKNVSCAAYSDGAIDITVTGGTHPYAYSWSNGASTEDISGLSAGDHTVTVEDVKGCKLSKVFKVTEPLPLVITRKVINVTCYAGNNGSIDVSVSGGTPPYNYKWSNGSSTQDIHNLSSGVYGITVYDAHECWTWEAVQINATPPMSVTAVVKPVSAFGGTNGSIDITVTSGTPAYNYKWSTGAITQDIHNLSSGVYKVTVTDEHQCPVIKKFEVVKAQNVGYSSEDTLHVTGKGGGNKMSEDAFDGETPEGRLDIDVFPTVSDGAVTIRFNFDATSEIHIRISDMQGRLLFQDAYGDVTKGDARPLDLHRLARGMYMITADHHGTSVTHQVVVH